MGTEENQVMRRVIALRRLKERWAKEEDERKNHLTIQTRALQDGVKSGWTTGTLITDYFLRVHGIIDLEAAQPLHELEERMKGKVGQMFLVVQCTRRRNEFEKRYFTGILTSEDLVFSFGRYGLPTNQAREVVAGRIVKLDKGPFLFPLMGGVHAPNKVIIGSQWEREFVVVVGDENVSVALRNARGWTVLARVCRSLGREIPAE